MMNSVFSVDNPVIAARPITAHPSRRGAVRVAAMIPVELNFSYGSGNTISAHSVDIGMGGLCVQTASIIDGQAVQSVRITLGSELVEFGVSSRWTATQSGGSGPLTGLVFDSLDAEEKAKIWNCVQERAKDLGIFLGRCAGLDRLNFEESLDLALATRLRDVKCGELVYRGGDDDSAASIYALMKGSVLIEPAAGRRNESISNVKPRELLGGLPVVAGCEAFERAIAVEDVTVLEFTSYAVENLLNTKPQLGVALIRAASFHWMRRFADVLDRTLTA